MTSLKWFSGAKERRQVAIETLDHLLASLDDNANNLPLKQLLAAYREELNQEIGAISIVLSRLMLDLSNCLKDNHITLSQEQEKDTATLRQLLNIRFG